MPTASARIETKNATRYLEEICRQLRQTVEAKPDAQARIEWSGTQGTVDFGWGRCIVDADPRALSLRAVADDEGALESIQEIFTRHLGHVAAGDGVVGWQRAGVPTGEPDDAVRRARMRDFHRRVRHSPAGGAPR